MKAKPKRKRKTMDFAEVIREMTKDPERTIKSFMVKPKRKPGPCCHCGHDARPRLDRETVDRVAVAMVTVCGIGWTWLDLTPAERRIYQMVARAAIRAYHNKSQDKS